MAMSAQEMKNKNINPLLRQYEPSFKKAVILYAEQKSVTAARKKYGISDSNIRRWRKLKKEILEKASKPSRRSQRCVNGSQKNYRENSVENNSNDTTDSMPLLKRIDKKEEVNTNNESAVLHSQPLSPTKLKVTRQQQAVVPVDEVCLKWNSHYQHLKGALPVLLASERYSDVTITSQGHNIKCHRVIMSSCSTYFESILKDIPIYQHAVLFMGEIPYWVLKSLCDFIYAGEVHILQDKLEELLRYANILQIKGLTKNMDEKNEKQQPQVTENIVKEEKLKQPKVEPVAPTKIKQKQVNTRHRGRPSLPDNFTNPMDLLEPVYEEEIKKDPLPPPVKQMKQNQPTAAFAKNIKRSAQRRVRKRRYFEEKEDSPTPVFTSRKGTRSRPNVKVPKYFQSSDSTEEVSTVEPEQNQIINVEPTIQFEEIKAEPLDIEDIEENFQDFGELEDINPGDPLKLVDIGSRRQVILTETPQIITPPDPLNLPEKLPKDPGKSMEIVITNVESISDPKIDENSLGFRIESIESVDNNTNIESQSVPIENAPVAMETMPVATETVPVAIETTPVVVETASVAMESLPDDKEGNLCEGFPREENQPEKTLEMIVNDLNESLEKDLKEGLENN